MIAWSLLGAGCAPDPGPSTAVDVATEAQAPRILEATLTMPESGVRFARGLTVRTDPSTSLSLRIDDGELVRRVEWLDEGSTEHQVPVLGLPPETEIRVSVTVRDALGSEATVELEPFETTGVPDRFPRVDVLVLDPVRMAAGYRLLNVTSPDDTLNWLVVFDALARPVWLLDQAPAFGDVRMTPQGTLVGLRGGPAEVDLLGREVGDLHEVSVGRKLHHELYPLDDGGFLSLAYTDAQVDAYPRSYDTPDVLEGPAQVQSDDVLWLGADGTIEATWPLLDRLDTGRIGFGSLELAGIGPEYDWSHANAVVPHPDGGVVVSVRNQSALVALDAAGDVRWILADPLGWSAAFAPLLLTPVGDVQWPYRQHAPELTPDGLWMVFDNHNDGHTPYGPGPAEQPPSRVVAYAVDEDAGTVTQAFSAVPTTQHLVSRALGDADMTPAGTVLIDHGFLDGEDGVLNADVGRGRKSIRLIEIDPDAPEAPVLDLRLWGALDEEPEGYKAYRAEHLPTVYGVPALETWE